MLLRAEGAVACSECGHLHFEGGPEGYSRCPLAPECTCPLDDGQEPAVKIVNHPLNTAWTRAHPELGDRGVTLVHLRLVTDEGTHLVTLSAAAATWIGRELLREGEAAAQENMARARG
jgi:hypothetical protein